MRIPDFSSRFVIQRGIGVGFLYVLLLSGIYTLVVAVISGFIHRSPTLVAKILMIGLLAAFMPTSILGAVLGFLIGLGIAVSYKYLNPTLGFFLGGFLTGILIYAINCSFSLWFYSGLFKPELLGYVLPFILLLIFSGGMVGKDLVERTDIYQDWQREMPINQEDKDR